MTLTTTPKITHAGRGWNIATWGGQIALAALYLMAAYMKGLMPILQAWA